MKSCTIVLLFCLIMLGKPLSAQQQKSQIIYFGDPMCSWCYGFAPEIEQIKAAFPNIEFEVVLGGLRPYGKQKMSELSDFLKTHWLEIEEETHQPFAYDILELDEYIYDTEPASRAVETARQLKPSITLDFFKAVQTAFYYQNKSTHDIKTYLNLAEKFGLDIIEFENLFYSEKIINLTKQNFVRSAESGVNGFPTVVLKKGEQYHLITNGYQKAEDLVEKIKTVLK